MPVWDLTSWRRGAARGRARPHAHAEMVVSAMADGYVLTADGAIVDVNDAFVKMVGLSRDELVGLRPPFPYWPPELARSIEQGRLALWSGEGGTAEHQLMRRDGRRFPAELTVRSAEPVDNDGVAWRVTLIRDLSERRRTQAELLERERQLAEAQRVAQVGNWEWDLGSGELTWSEELCRLFGRPGLGAPADFDGYLECVEPGDRDRVLDVIARALATEETYSMDHGVVWPDGSVRMVHCLGSVERGPDGTPSRVFGTAQDVTDRLTALAAIAERERQLAEAQALAHLGSFEFDIAAGTVSWSDEHCRIAGRAPGFVPTLEDIRSLPHPEDREIQAAGLAAARRGDFCDSTFRIVRPDGVVRHVHVRRFGRFDEHGTLTHIAGSILDVTERVLAEQELRDARRHAETILASMHEGYALAVDGRLVAVNRALCEITGFSEAELVNVAPPLPFWPEDQLSAAARVRAQVHAEEGGTYEVTLGRKDGSRFIAEVTSQPARRRDGTVLGYVNTVRDIGERKDREAAQRSLSRIARLVAQSAGPTAVFEEIAQQLLKRFGGHSGIVVQFDPLTRRGVFVTGVTEDGSVLAGSELSLDGTSAPAQVFRTGRPARSGGSPSTGVTGAVAGQLERISDAVAVPIVVAGRLWGSVGVAFAEGSAPAETEDRLGRFADLAAMAIANAEAWELLSRQAATDSLTGLANHRTFRDRLQSAVEDAASQRRALGLVMIDVDHFKSINDTHGHHTGDRVLVQLAAQLTAAAGPGELVARVGGEEFAWLIPRADPERARSAAERLRIAIEAGRFDTVGRVSISVGVASLSADEDADGLIRCADAALYQAKAAGRNRTVLHTDEWPRVAVP